jgi:hypothetical protein
MRGFECIRNVGRVFHSAIRNDWDAQRVPGRADGQTSREARERKEDVNKATRGRETKNRCISDELDFPNDFPIHSARELLLLVPGASVHSQNLRTVILQHASKRQSIRFGAHLADFARYRNVEVRV